MNKYIINTLLTGVATLALASCGENTWNDHYLKGFEGGVDYENAVSGSYTLTADDYKSISSLMVSLATTDEETAEAKAIATNCYFDKYGSFPASVALPPYLKTSSFPYYLASNGSQIDITYEEASETPAELTAIAGATQYTVTTDDYKEAWGSDEAYISAFAPAASADSKLPAILKSAISDASAGAYAIVSYEESPTNPIFMASADETTFIGGTYYLVADGDVAAEPLAESYTYGYLGKAEAVVSDGLAVTDHVNAFTFEPTDGGFYLKDTYGRYVYQTGTYNSFNLSSSVPSDGAVWNVAVASDGKATITNASVGKWIQYSSNYSSWGSYSTESGSLPVLYYAAPNNGDYYLVADDTNGAGALANKTYGYFPLVEMQIIAGGVQTDAENAFTFEITDGGYYIKDAFGRYVYQTGTYNSFNLSESLPESGAVWDVTVDKDGLATILNTSVEKWMQYDSTYSSWGSYNSQQGSLPRLYMASAVSMVTETSDPVEKNAVYYYDGSAWSVADGVSILNPADYTAMGVSSLSDDEVEIYIPMYLKNKLIYAQAGDEQYVVYNTNKVDLFVYDGANWTINNNGLETVVGRFTKANDAWSFTKYIGKAVFDYFGENQIIRDRSYLLVAEGICATALDKSYSYGYIYPASVTISGQTIVLATDAYAYNFASTATVDDKTYTAPDGQFLMEDSNGRYLYMTGSYNSFNIRNAPVITDGAIDSAYLWTAEQQSDGTWQIKNVGLGRIWAYAINYSSFGAYDSLSDSHALPYLYIMSE